MRNLQKDHPDADDAGDESSASSQPPTALSSAPLLAQPADPSAQQTRCSAPQAGVLLVTHGKLGMLLVETIKDLLGELPLATDVLEVRRVQATDGLLRQGERMLERLDSGGGVLILTDTYGSTPSNIANRLAGDRHDLEVIAGLNLPMLLRLYNYAKLPLPALARAAAEGGQRGIVICPRGRPHPEESN